MTKKVSKLFELADYWANCGEGDPLAPRGDSGLEFFRGIGKDLVELLDTVEQLKKDSKDRPCKKGIK